MTWRVPPFDRAANELVAYVRATYAPLGIVVSGSIVRGEADPTSDLDVFVVHAEPWRLRDQRRFAGVPVEVFVNPPAQVRRYFEREHADGRPCTAHMFATGEVIEAAHPVIAELVREARDWLSRPFDVSEASLTQRRYGAVDLLDDARDVIDRDPAAAALLLADAVRTIVEYAFWRRGRFQPRRKDTVVALEAIDSEAATLVRRWQTGNVAEGLRAVEALARHVLNVDQFFEWTSPREAVAE
jgi:predicted nucleotidyltransferase